MCDDQIVSEREKRFTPVLLMFTCLHSSQRVRSPSVSMLAAPCSDITRHAVELRDRGLTVIRNSGLDATLVAAAQTS